MKSIVPFRWGYVIAETQNGRVTHILSRIFSDKQAAEQALKENKYSTRNNIDTEVRAFVEFNDSTDQSLHLDIYLKSLDENSIISKMETPLVLEVVYNIPEGVIESMYIHDGKLNEVEYDLSDTELLKIKDRIMQYVNVKNRDI